MGWKGKINGELFALARDEFDALITLHQSMPHQQNMTAEDVALVVLRVRTSDTAVSRALVPQIVSRLDSLRRGEVVFIPPQ